MFKYSLSQQIPLQSMTSGMWKPIPRLSIPLSPWDGARRSCSQAEQAHGTLGRAKMGRSELPVLNPGQTALGHVLVWFPSLTYQPKIILTPTKGPVQSPGTWGKALNGPVSSGMWRTSCSSSLLLQGDSPDLLLQQAAPTHQSGLGEHSVSLPWH